MLKVQVEDTLYGIGFEHVTIKEVVGDDHEFTAILGRPVKKTIETRNTFCTIFMLDSDGDGKQVAQALAKGHARCSPLDNFNKEEGRKVALSKALKLWFPGVKEGVTDDTVINQNRKVREAIWKGYHSRWVNDAFQNIEKAVNEDPEMI